MEANYVHKDSTTLIQDKFMKNGVFSLEYDKETLRDMVLELQEENKNLLYYKKIIVKDYPSKEDSNYILCNMSKQELYKLLCETRERIYKGG